MEWLPWSALAFVWLVGGGVAVIDSYGDHEPDEAMLFAVLLMLMWPFVGLAIVIGEALRRRYPE